ncbi:hypothetical protein ACW5WN_13020 [Aeromonas lacus]
MEKIIFCKFTNSLEFNGNLKRLGARDAMVLDCLLKEPAGSVATKKSILSYAWSDVRVSDLSLSKSISLLRSTLNEMLPGQEVIVTMPRVGYKINKSLFIIKNDAETSDLDMDDIFLSNDDFTSSERNAIKNYTFKRIISTTSYTKTMKVILSVLSIVFFCLSAYEYSNSSRFLSEKIESPKLNMMTTSSGNEVYYLASSQKLIEALENIKCDCVFFVYPDGISLYDIKRNRAVSFLLQDMDTSEISKNINSILEN